jgi:hypothetical protein
MAPTEKLGLRLPPDVAAWLRQQGEENMRSMAAEVALLVRAEIKRRGAAKKRRKTP